LLKVVKTLVVTMHIICNKVKTGGHTVGSIIVNCIHL